MFVLRDLTIPRMPFIFLDIPEIIIDKATFWEFYLY